MVGSLKIRILKLYEFVFFVCEIVLYSIVFIYNNTEKGN